MEKTTFEKVYALNVNERTENKGGLTYLSWAWAWAEFKKLYPEATYTVKKFGEAQLPYVASDAGYMVFTEVAADGITHEMWLPVLDNRNKAVKDNLDMFLVNKSLMRCLTKNLAMFGLGLYIYAGEDLPEETEESWKESIDAIKTVEEGREYYAQSRGKGAVHDKYLQDHIDKLKKKLSEKDIEELAQEL